MHNDVEKNEGNKTTNDGYITEYKEVILKGIMYTVFTSH